MINLKSLFDGLLRDKRQQIIFFMSTDVTLSHYGHCRHLVTVLHRPVDNTR